MRWVRVGRQSKVGHSPVQGVVSVDIYVHFGGLEDHFYQYYNKAPFEYFIEDSTINSC